QGRHHVLKKEASECEGAAFALPGFIASPPEWLSRGGLRRPTIPASGSALRSHPCIAVIFRPGVVSICSTGFVCGEVCRNNRRQGITTLVLGPLRWPFFQVTTEVEATDATLRRAAGLVNGRPMVGEVAVVGYPL